MRAGSLTFFTGSNPGIIMGGMLGESKYDVLKLLPPPLVPKTILIRQPANVECILQQIRQAGFSFPMIFKPDLGERGYMVRKINQPDDIANYLKILRYDFLVQEFVDLPAEFGVFYRRLPNEQNGRVTSIVKKEMLFVVGDGKSTLHELILLNDRAKLQLEKLKISYNGQLDKVIPPNRKIELVSIGNHCLGTKFLNGNDLITTELSENFDRISKQIDGFYFGRFDLRCQSDDDLVKGNIKVLELNGCGAEPAHIYDPGFPLFSGISTLMEHWRTIFEIAIQNKRLGYRFLSLKEAFFHYKNFKSKITDAAP